MHGREHQFDGPFSRKALGLQRVRQPQTADGQVGPGGASAVELFFDILPFADLRADGQKVQIRAYECVVDVGRAHFNRRHAAFAG